MRACPRIGRRGAALTALGFTLALSAIAVACVSSPDTSSNEARTETETTDPGTPTSTVTVPEPIADARFPFATLRVSGSIDLDSQRVEFDPTRALPTAKPIETGSGPFTAELLDASGTVMESNSFELSRKTDGSSTADFSVELPRPDQHIALVRIMHESNELARVEGHDSFPTVSIIHPKPGDSIAIASAEFSWNGSTEDDAPLFYTAMVSFDGGLSATSLLSNSPKTSMAVTNRVLERSDNAVLIVAVSDGVNTAWVVSEVFSIS